MEKPNSQLDKMLSRIDMRAFLDSMDPAALTIVVINVRVYMASENTLFIPGEIGLTAFSINEGIMDNYWSLIDPYYVPVGFNVEKYSQRIGLPVPPYSNRFQDYRVIINNIARFLKKHQNPKLGKTLVFCTNENRKAICGSLDWLYGQCDLTSDIKLYSLGDLAHQLSNFGIARRAARENVSFSMLQAKYVNPGSLFAILGNSAQPSLGFEVPAVAAATYSKASSGYHTWTENECAVAKTQNNLIQINAGMLMSTYSSRRMNPDVTFFNEKDLEDHLRVQELAFYSNIGCLHHMPPEREGWQYCALYQTNRYAYCVLGALVSHFGVVAMPGYHCPNKANREHEEQRRISLLSKWGHAAETYFTEEKFSYDGKPPPEFSTRLADKLHPRDKCRPDGYYD